MLSLPIHRFTLLVGLLVASVQKNVLVVSLQPPSQPKSSTQRWMQLTVEEFTAMSIPSAATTTALEAPSPRVPSISTQSVEPAIWKLALAGSVATLVSDAAMHPIDCIKTLQQSDQGIGLSMMGAAQVIYSQLGGLEGFYRGFATYAACDFVGGAIKFATYESLKQRVQGLLEGNALSTALFICAALSFVTSSVVTVPGELLKQQLQMGYFGDTWEAMNGIFQQHGLSGFYQGYDGVFLRDVPYTAMELGLYDLFKKLYLDRKNDSTKQQEDGELLGTKEQVLLAGLTGGITGYVTTPLDTIKTKLMVDAQFQGSSFATCLVSTIHDHGWDSIFCGADARVAWLIPTLAIYLPTYDFLKNQITSPTMSSIKATEATESA